MQSTQAIIILFLLLTCPQKLLAQACGGDIVAQDDCQNNNRKWYYSCCPDGYRVQGIAYTDIQKQDHVDAISAICRNIAKGNDVMASSDFSRLPKTLVCNKQDVLAGIFFKDVRTDAGEDKDTLDGVTALCQTPASQKITRIPNNDIDENPREGVSASVSLPKRVVGFAYKERDNGGKEPGTSDRADCVTIITK